ncbi:MAG: SDR family oxidoreductase [Gammaproteobacteria bacterium]|nr:SDR family oxidoreductase [Gammaproteobacteria bacterium]MBU2479103.1 SDR family oxidoreductase [Gammaproteobacteria bacterium]
MTQTSYKETAGSHPERLFRLDGAVILLTGATGHLGTVLAHGLAAAGAHVLVNARHAETVEPLVQALRDAGHAATSLVFDISDEHACHTAMAQIEQAHGTLHGIVNNAFNGRAATVESANARDFDASLRLNVTAPFMLVQTALPMLKHAARSYQGGASIVNIASMYGMVSPDPRIYGDSGANNPPFYGAAKAGMIQLTRYLSCHLGPDNIRVNSISPGAFPRPAIAQDKPEFHKHLCDKTPLGRIGQAQELVGPVLFLLSSASSYITGANLPVDGGWTAW